MTPKAEHLEKRITRLERCVNPRPELDALSLMRQRRDRIWHLLGDEQLTPTPEEMESVEKLRRWVESGKE